MDINSPKDNDNRRYDYSFIRTEYRKEYDFFVKYIKHNTKVIDLGCGNGSLLKLLKDKNNIVESGIEIAESGIIACREKQLNVIQGSIDQDLPYKNNEFDYAICNVTIQMVNYPEKLLSEMKRISNFLIISFPNFAFYKNRLDLLFNGRVPKQGMFGYKWYSTGHIHQLSIVDFYELINDIGGLQIIHFQKTYGNTVKDHIINIFPNMFSIIPIFVLQKDKNV